MSYPAHLVTVEGLISNNENQVLLVKSPLRGWEIPGGQVEIGENLIEALIREVKEESGINVKVEKLAGIYSNIMTELTQFYVPTKVIFSFIGSKVSGNLSTSDESVDVGWFDRDKVLSMIDYDVYIDRVGKALNYDGSLRYSSFHKNPYTVLDEYVL